MKKNLLFFVAIIAICYQVSAQKIGGKVRVLEYGVSKSGTILSIKQGQYFIHLDNYSSSTDKYYKDDLNLVFIDGDDRKPLVVRDTVVLTKTRVDTVYKGKDNVVTIINLKGDTVYQTLHDTIIIQRTKRDTVFKYKIDTVSIFKNKRDTIYKYKYDTVSIFKTKRDTVFNLKRDTIVIKRTIKDTIITTKTETVNATPDKKYAFRLGDLVLAYDDGDWKPAVIVDIKSDETYKVKFDTYSDYYNKVLGIDSLKLRNPKVENTPVYRLGDLVQVYQDTEWKPAVIIEIKDKDSYKVKYDGYSDYYNNVVGVGSIKPR